MKQSKTRVERVTEQHHPALRVFFHEVWGGSLDDAVVNKATLGTVLSRPANNPEFVCIREGKILAYLGTLVTQFWNGKGKLDAHWLKGFWVLPEFQNGPLGFVILQKAVRELDVCGAMPVAEAAVRLFRESGFTDLGRIPNFLHVLRFRILLKELQLDNSRLAATPIIERVLRLLQQSRMTYLAGSLLDALQHLTYPMCRIPTRLRSRRIDIAELERSELEALWTTMCSHIKSSMVRDALYLQTRYNTGEGGGYVASGIYASDRLVGLVVVKLPSNKNRDLFGRARIATISDALLASNSKKLVAAAVRTSVELAREFKADALVCSTPNALLTSQLQRHLFIRISRSLHLLIKDNNHPTLAMHLEDWWSMRGDAYSDEGL